MTIFFGASYQYGKVLLYQMTRVTPTGVFDLSTFQKIQGINDSSVYNAFNGQPSMSDSLNWVVFVRAAQFNWNDNDLFLANKWSIASVFNLDDVQISSSAFPNPSSEYLIIRYKTSSGDPITLSVFSSLGALVYENVINPSSRDIKICTKAMKVGFYFYRLSQGNNQKTRSGNFVVLHSQ